MSNETRIKLENVSMIAVYVLALSFFIYGKIMLYTNPVPEQLPDYSLYPFYLIPIMYIWNYLKAAWFSISLAFLLSGIIQEILPQNVIEKYLKKDKIRNYFIAAALAPLFITCSCSVIPIYVGIVAAGASLGVAMTFFLMAPAANLITILLTGEYIGWDLGIWRLIFSLIAAVICGIIFDKTKIARKLEEQISPMKVGRANRMQLKLPLNDRLKNMYRFSFQVFKKIFPLLLLGLLIVSYIAAYLPDNWIESYFTGFFGIVIAAVLGGPLYTPTLVEIVLTREFINKGMTRDVALSFMMGQPYDIVSMVPNSKYFKWQGVLLYTVIFFLFSIISGVLYGLVYGLYL